MQLNIPEVGSVHGSEGLVYGERHPEHCLGVRVVLGLHRLLLDLELSHQLQEVFFVLAVGLRRKDFRNDMIQIPSSNPHNNVFWAE